MHVPQREGVVVAVGEQNGVGFAAVEVHLGDVARRVAVAAVVVVPVLCNHDGRDPQSQHRNTQGQRRGPILGEQLIQRNYAKAHPNGKYIKRAHKGVVALARLKGLVVGINHNGEPGKQKEQGNDPSVALVALGLKPQTQQTKNQGQGVVVVAALLPLHRVRQVGLRAKAYLVDEVNARHPVAIDQLIAVLVVVLAPGKIPHEIAEVHLANLIVQKVLKMIGERDFFVGIGAKNLLVVFYVVGLIRPHPREKSHVAFGIIGLLGPCFVDHLIPSCSLAVEVGWSAVAVGFLVVELAVETLAIKHGPVSVLLAVVVGQKRQSILGVVLVNGRVGVGANGQHHEARVANQNHHHSQNTLLHQRTIGLYRPANSEINPRNNSNCH